jgi:epsilon-lactone hydrolase
LLYFHGGGYALGSVAGHRPLCAALAKVSGADVVSVDYRLAPEHPHPAAVDDACSAYGVLLGTGSTGEAVVIGGDSAGGGLALALAVLARDERRPAPAGIVAISPWVDLALTGDSLVTRRTRDPVLSEPLLRRFAAWYVGDADPRDPIVSPLYADLRRLPPTLLQVGDDEILLDDAVRLARRLCEAGVDVELDVWPEVVHGWHAFAISGVPEATEALERIGVFVRRCLVAAATDGPERCT